MAVQYETKATNVGGRKGHVNTDDNAINVDVLPPQQADGNATNPEQLFLGYASCFNGAFDLILKQNKVRDEPEVTLTVRLEDDPDAESPKLSVAIDAKVKNVLSQEDEKYLQDAHEFCPYSKATRGNIDVDLNVQVVD